jgi:hypothetical protein
MIISHVFVLLISYSFINIITCHTIYNDFFYEELMLKPLSSNHVYAYFQFTTIWEAAKRTEIRKQVKLNCN